MIEIKYLIITRFIIFAVQREARKYSSQPELLSFFDIKNIENYHLYSLQ